MSNSIDCSDPKQPVFKYETNAPTTAVGYHNKEYTIKSGTQAELVVNSDGIVATGTGQTTDGQPAAWTALLPQGQNTKGYAALKIGGGVPTFEPITGKSAAGLRDKAQQAVNYCTVQGKVGEIGKKLGLPTGP